MEDLLEDDKVKSLKKLMINDVNIAMLEHISDVWLSPNKTGYSDSDISELTLKMFKLDTTMFASVAGGLFFKTKIEIENGGTHLDDASTSKFYIEFNKKFSEASDWDGIDTDSNNPEDLIRDSMARVSSVSRDYGHFLAIKYLTGDWAEENFDGGLKEVDNKISQAKRNFCEQSIARFQEISLLAMIEVAKNNTQNPS